MPTRNTIILSLQEDHFFNDVIYQYIDCAKSNATASNATASNATASNACIISPLFYRQLRDLNCKFLDEQNILFFIHGTKDYGLVEILKDIHENYSECTQVYILANKCTTRISYQVLCTVQSIFVQGNDADHFFTTICEQTTLTFRPVKFDKNRIEQYQQVNKEEQQYLDLLCRLVKKDSITMDRTGTGIIASFGETLRFDLSTGRIPLLTSKRTFFRGSVEEMLFFLSGSTDVNRLREKKVHIWDGNTNREFLDKNGLSHYEEFDMGPTYSFLFRHAGAEADYKGKNHDYEGLGVNQFEEVIRGIKENPYSRRHMINLWSPAHLSKMSLPPCLFNYIFHVDKESSSISLHVTMRSADVFLGVPFNLCGAALILRMVCHLTKRPPGELFLVMTNAHLYANHVEQARTQLQREPYLFPILKFNRSPEEIKNGDGFCTKDFVLMDYNCHPTIKAQMAV